MNGDFINDESGEWFFRARPCQKASGALAWCAKTPKLGAGPLDVPGDQRDVHFEFGPSVSEAIRKLKSKVLQ